uniref:Transmembrane protein n=1 Tax=Panagrolaimus sp. ES5 TaxID=591445 RepID=A0AC34G133_9BILA
MATSQHTGSGTLRGGGVKRIYGNMASLKQYKNKIDYRLPLVSIICLVSISSILFLYGLYQLKGHDTLVEYVKNTRDIVRFVTDPRNKRDTAEFVEPLATPGDDDPAEDIQKDVEAAKATETATMAKSEVEEDTTKIIPGIIVVENNFTSTSLAMTSTTPPTTTTTFLATTTILIVEATTTPFGPEWLTLDELDDMHHRLTKDPCVPKIKDSLFPAYATVFLILLDILPFIFAFFTYIWDAYLKDCTHVREARMRVELNNQRRPQTREEILRGAIDQQHW